MRCDLKSKITLRILHLEIFVKYFTLLNYLSKQIFTSPLAPFLRDV